MFKKPSSGKKTNMSQFGLLDMDIDDGDDENLDLSDDDIDLEAELAKISGGGGKKPPRQRKPAPVPAADLNAMIAQSLKDVPSDDEGSDVDEDDPELLSELKELAIDDEESAPPPPPRTSRPAPPPPGTPISGQSSIVSVLQDRISNYTLAEKNAKESGESSRARRFGRGIKTLNDLLKQARAGKPINDADIPPPVSLGKPSSPQAAEPPPTVPEPVPSAPEPEEGPPSLPEPTEPPPPPPAEAETSDMSPTKQRGLQIILQRQEEFKAAALSAKRAGDKPLALELLKVVKQFDMVVDAYKGGQEMDLSELPTPQDIAAAFRSQPKEEAQVQTSEDPAPPATDSGLITASTLAEGLKQRLAAFEQQEAKAKEEGNSSKARRMGRIVKQYKDAIRMHAAGKPVPVDELPTPAGHGPLPTADGAPAPAAAAAAPRPSPPAPRPAPAAPAPAASGSRHEKQLALLLHRQKQFKEAAIKAKKAGDIEQAKEYLRAAKGFDSVIEAAKGGLVVDLQSLPLPPRAKTQLENTFDIVSTEDCGPTADGPTTISADDSDVLSRLHHQLSSQLKLCQANRDHNKAMGHIAKAKRFEHLAITKTQGIGLYPLFDIVSAEDCGPTADGPATISADDSDVLSRLHHQLSSQLKLCQANRDHNKAMGHIAEANRFEHLAITVQQDLDVVAVAKRRGQDPPKFHYESRQFSVVQCNTDLNENDLELTIVRGIAYNVPNPKEVDTYVKFEFPYPQDAPVSDRTPLVKDTNSPSYDAVFPLTIHRGARPCLRVFKRHAIKLEVYSRGGWFRSDSLLGSCAVKLAPLETQCTLHEAFPLMDGRRPAGGSIEVKLRVRTPLLQQQVEQTTHRWLVIDN